MDVRSRHSICALAFAAGLGLGQATAALPQAGVAAAVPAATAVQSVDARADRDGRAELTVAQYNPCPAGKCPPR